MFGIFIHWGDYCAEYYIKIQELRVFYITKSYTDAQGRNTSAIIRKSGTSAELSKRFDINRGGIMVKQSSFGL